MSAPLAGWWACRQCPFVLKTMSVSMAGDLGADGRLRRERCPNGHGLLVQATEDLLRTRGWVPDDRAHDRDDQPGGPTPRQENPMDHDDRRLQTMDSRLAEHTEEKAVHSAWTGERA